MTEFNQQYWDKLRLIVREEVDASVDLKTADMRSDVSVIKQVQGNQSLILRTMNSSLVNLKNSVRAQGKEVARIGILLEDLEYRFEAGGELA